jgi:hypothetical protein
MNYNADFRYDLEWGQVGENTVAEIVAGDKTEVKSERDIWANTGNHYVEISSRGKPSGIQTTEAKWWTINFFNKDKLCFSITVATDSLYQLMKEGYKHKGWKKIPGGDNNTSWGILVPITALIGIR